MGNTCSSCNCIRYFKLVNNYLNKFDKSFLIIGSSIPLGWGVEKEKTFAHLLNIESKKKGKKWIFINGGVGNYNASRYVNNYLKYWKDLVGKEKENFRFFHVSTDEVFGSLNINDEKL